MSISCKKVYVTVAPVTVRYTAELLYGVNPN